MVDRLNQRFRLGLELVPTPRLYLHEKLTKTAQTSPLFLNRLSEGLERSTLSGINKILAREELVIEETAGHYRIKDLEKKLAEQKKAPAKTPAKRTTAKKTTTPKKDKK